MSHHLLNFMKKNEINNFIVGFAALFFSGMLISLIILYPVKAVYLGVVGGNYLLGVDTVTAQREVTTDDPLAVAFCRTPKTRIIAVHNVRTFYVTDTDTAVYQRNLPDDISYERTDNPCQALSIMPDQRPNAIGKYRFCQEFDFSTEFNQRKTARFCSTEYSIIKA